MPDILGEDLVSDVPDTSGLPFDADAGDDGACESLMRQIFREDNAAPSVSAFNSSI